MVRACYKGGVPGYSSSCHGGGGVRMRWTPSLGVCYRRCLLHDGGRFGFWSLPVGA